MNESDAEVAVKEAFQAFCIISEKHGMGIENELEYIGWERDMSGLDTDNIVMKIPVQKPVMERVMDTGDTRLLSVAI